MPIINGVIKGKQPVIESLTVTPSTSAQTISAPTGTDGYGPVNVTAVTSSIDANIVASNIKNGVSILGVTGDYTGSGPAYYIEKANDNGTLTSPTSPNIINLNGIEDIGVGVLSYAYYGNTNVSGALDFSGIKKLSGDNCFDNAFRGSSNITSVDFSGLEEITGNFCLNYAFYQATNLTSADFSSLFNIDITTSVQVSNRSNAFNNTFYNTNISNIEISNLECVFGGYSWANTFSGCPITNVQFTSLSYISGDQNGFYPTNGVTTLTSCPLPSLVVVGSSNCLSSIFKGTSITTYTFDNLSTVTGNNSFKNAFANTSLTYLSFPKLQNVRSGALSNMLSGVTGCTVHFPSSIESTISSWTEVINGFGGTNTTVLFDLPAVTDINFKSWSVISYNVNLSYTAENTIKDIYFYALREVRNTNCFNYMAGNTTNCTLHFPKNLDPQTGSTVISSLSHYPRFGNSSTTVAFDLPSSYILIGADGKKYKRDPLYDTTTTLAWKNKKAYEPCYTSGTSDPAIGTTIYSDVSCTTVITTVSSIS